MRIEVQVQVQVVKPSPLSLVDEARGKQILTGNKFSVLLPTSFSQADFDEDQELDDSVKLITGFHKVKDLCRHYAIDLSLRCLNDDPSATRRETMKRDLISPLLYLAAALGGKLSTILSDSSPSGLPCPYPYEPGLRDNGSASLAHLLGNSTMYYMHTSG